MRTIDEWAEMTWCGPAADYYTFEELIKAIRNEAIDACIEAIERSYLTEGKMIKMSDPGIEAGFAMAIKAIEDIKGETL